jgi:cellulose biosynthesis protein BcsQ
MKFPDEIDDDIKRSYVYHVILEKNKFSIPDVARKSSFCNPEFDVIPSHIDLMAHEFELKEGTNATKTRLLKKLEEVASNYDIVLIDTPPSLNLYAEIALITADYLLIPSDLKPFANEGLNNVRRFINDINEDREDRGRTTLEVLGILPSKIATHARFVEHTLPKMEKTVEERYGYKVLNSRIYERRDASAAIEKTIVVGDLDIPDPQSVLDFKPDSASALEFKRLAEEIISLTGL